MSKSESLAALLTEVRACSACADVLPLGPRPILQLSTTATILVASQAPGSRAHQTGVPFSDASGDRLRDWMGLTDAQFYDETTIARVPMGFCYPGRSGGGDAPPRKECAQLWRGRMMELLPEVRLTLLVGSYAQLHLLGPGSTTERVLRETTVPVLVTPAEDAGPTRAEDAPARVRRILTPVDLTAATAHQVAVAQKVAEHLGLPLLLLHVIEPVRSMVAAHPRLPKIDAERRDRAERQLEEFVQGVPPRVKPEGLIAYGEPAEEIAKVAAERGAGLIVMGLHSSPLLGPRMGSVTYRVLCLAHRLVLAIPPQPSLAFRLSLEETAAQAPASTGS